MRKFGYGRVSTVEQDLEVQTEQLAEQGIEQHRIVCEKVSGAVCAKDRSGFQELLIKMEAQDQLVVMKLDRLGRDMIDVMSTLELLAEKQISVVSVDLGLMDLNSPAGKLQVQVMAAVAEFERNRIAERCEEGRAKARAEGRSLGGRPIAVATRLMVQEAKQKGLTQVEVSKQLGKSLSTIKRHWN
ncbi:recombinase family protein [Vibrio maerlii]|uniref:recombinase family protein n=1 Tax=Vibrio maerlii TaxID=2231648 RepID=UPI000E3E79EA|nr:recombinase family protein [Vibrio maerlii]